MSDPRNDAHDKKVAHEKKKQESAEATEAVTAETGVLTEVPTVPNSAALEGSLAVLAQLKELEFHSRAHIERIAALTLTVEDELKQRTFVAPLGEVYSAQSAVQTRLTALIEAYQAECDRLAG